jgi:hypothetical protein
MNPSSESVIESPVAANELDLAPKTLHQFQNENFSIGHSAMTNEAADSASKADDSAFSGHRFDTKYGQKRSLSFFGPDGVANSTGSANSANPEPSPATSKARNKPKRTSEVVVPTSHAMGALQGRQNQGFSSKTQISAISAQNRAPPKPAQVSLTSPNHLPTPTIKGNSSKSGQIGGDNSTQSEIGM